MKDMKDGSAGAVITETGIYSHLWSSKKHTHTYKDCVMHIEWLMQENKLDL